MMLQLKYVLLYKTTFTHILQFKNMINKCETFTTNVSTLLLISSNLKNMSPGS